MRKHLTLLAATTIAASLGFWSSPEWSRAEDGPAERTGEKIDRAAENAGQKMEHAGERIRDAVRNDATAQRGMAAVQLPPGVKPKELDEADDIAQTIAQATKAALTKDGFDDVVERFVDADRNRIGAFVKNEEQWKDLNNVLQPIRDAWKAKYGKDFDLDRKVAFGPNYQQLTIVQGEIDNPALLSNWPVQQKAGPAEGGVTTPRTDDRTLRIGELGRPSNTEGDRNLEKGREIAVVSLPASGSLPELFISMVQEHPDRWVIDVPDTLDGRKLHDNLKRHLTEFSQMQQQWPATADEAGRLLAHHVMLAFYDMNEPTARPLEH